LQCDRSGKRRFRIAQSIAESDHGFAVSGERWVEFAVRCGRIRGERSGKGTTGKDDGSYHGGTPKE
jgi:hypothetical protein